MNEQTEARSTGSLYCKFCHLCNYLQSPLLLLIRLYWGWQFLISGWGKFLNIESTAQFFNSLGIPLSIVSALTVASLEFVGGALLIVGLFSRVAALFLACIMTTAYWTAHHDYFINLFNDFNAFTAQGPFLFLYAALIILAFGPGLFSIDGMIRSKHSKQSNK